jgi:hypothetical protein
MATAPISLPQADTPEERYQRGRNLVSQRDLYEWLHPPGLPPVCKGIPEPEQFTHRKRDTMALDLANSILSAAVGLVEWKRKGSRRLSHYDALYHLERAPRVQQCWRRDHEFARERKNGINPFLITSIAEIPEQFPVTDETLRGVLPDGVTIAQLLDERRLFVCDWGTIAGAPIVPGRFQVAPIALFWLDGNRTLMPLAIQLGQTPAEAPVIFTPADDPWLWLTARSYVASADGTYHELIAHLTRTHLVIEAVWVAASRTLAPEHPLHELLAPHFTGTISINNEALGKLIAPGGPIDVSIAVGADGGLWLVEQEYANWRLDDWHPEADLERRGVLDPDVLPDYYYRDDALALYAELGTYVADLLGCFYRSDDDVRDDPELQAWAAELVSPDGGRMRGTPISERGRFETRADLIHFVHQVVYTVSVEHAAVNNGQWDQFGYVPNTPGAMYLPAPVTKHAWDEARLTYAMPNLKQATEQMALVHLLSEATQTPLGSYPDPFFESSIEAQLCVDRFRVGLDRVATTIHERNALLPAEEQYTYLLPFDVGRSIAI